MNTKYKASIVLGLTIAVSVFSFSHAKAIFKNSVSSLGVNIGLANVNYTVNYYLPNAGGTSFTLNSSEVVTSGGTLAHVPSTGAITNFTFEKWSTSNAFSDSFNTSSPITSNLNLYAGYYGYYVKGASDATYTQLPATSGSATKYNYNGANGSTSFSYTYALLGSDTLNDSGSVKIASNAFAGSSIGVYKRYRGTNTYTLVESKTSSCSNGKYKIYFNPSGGNNAKLYFVRTFIFEIQSYKDGGYIHLWNTGTSAATSWNGIKMTWMGETNSFYKRYWTFDIDTNKINKFKPNNYDYAGIELSFGNDVKDAYYSYQYGAGGWYEFDLSTQLYSTEG